jgi:hypothetical protein
MQYTQTSVVWLFDNENKFEMLQYIFIYLLEIK